jgi:hypothetical protein
MTNPWLKSNPFMSMWLSGANTMLGTARSQAMAEAERQTAKMLAQSTQQMMSFWTGALTAPPVRKKR